ncbi:Pentatricopeptide repeat-containing protein [Camellia lanceoleosa]|uniref:Pentatricopeptide repeat-containing protein n=1 Tax=Camellia lanceoleosa TaxID=1840588 RepID=A0ACC0I2W1_9ERIC|nr:Pentatricopeptide repeat-containing protein [Camellia lanceoleosa]
MAACSRWMNMVCEGFQILGFVLKLGLLWDVFVGIALLHFYGVYRFLSSAKRLFEEMPERNVVSWSSLMVAYLDIGDSRDVLNIYQQMRHQGVGCYQNTFTTIFSSCGLLEDELRGHQVLAHVIKTGYETNVSVANSLISMFGSFCSIQDACYVFDHMTERDTISWNSRVSAYVHNVLFKESLSCFHLMRLVHNEINSTTLSTLLSVCGTKDNLKWGGGIHGPVVKLGLDSNVCTGKTMNYMTFSSALAACSNPEFLVEGKIVHVLVITVGHHDNLIVGNALVTMYGKCSMMCEAEQVFQKMSKTDLVTWNALTGGYAENEEPGEAVKFFKLMRGGCIPANYITIVNVLGAFSAPTALMIHGMPLHANIVLTGFESDDYVKNSLITMYAKCGDLNSSNYIFSSLLDKNPVTWNAMVAANARHALAASANLAILDEGQQLHGLATKLGFDSYLYVTNATMDMYGKCGELDDALKMLPEPNMGSRLSWNILISAFARHGSFRKAKETFHDMLRLGSKPDHVTFVSLLSACSHGGLVDEGLSYFALMTKELGVPVGVEHCVCIIDLLGRS